MNPDEQPDHEPEAPARGGDSIDATMDAAVDAAVRAGAATGGPLPDASTIAEARARAQQMLADKDDGDAAGFRDLQGLFLSVGLPATQSIFRSMVTASGVTGAEKAMALNAILKFSPITELGCQEVVFYNMATQCRDTAYLFLGKCPKNHDLDTQLGKLKPLVAESMWPEILRHLSMLVTIGRLVYGNVALHERPLIRKLFGLAEDDMCEKFAHLNIDATNTTLFVDESWPERIGIFVQLKAEIEAAQLRAKTQKHDHRA